MSITGTAQDPSIDLPITAPHVIEAPVHIATTETPPTPDLLAATPPGITADPGITPNITTTNQPKDHQQQHEHHLKYKDKRQKPKQVSIDDPLSDYYSLDESESNSEDDLN